MISYLADTIKNTMFKKSHENGYLLAQKFGVRCAARLNNAPVAIFVLD